jgi:hypothetical protein
MNEVWKYGSLLCAGKKNELSFALAYWRNVILSRLIVAKQNNSDLIELYEMKLARANHLLSIINDSAFYVCASYEDCMDMKRALKKFKKIDR